MARALILILMSLAAVAVSGCVGPAAVQTAGSADDLVPALSADGRAIEGTAALVWQGKQLSSDGIAVSPSDRTPTTCDAQSCERFPFRVDLPDGYWDLHPGFVEVSIEWEHQSEDYASVTTGATPMGHYLGIPSLFMHVRVLNADGSLVQEGVDGFHYASVALVEALAPGDYIAEVQAYYGTGTYVGVVQIEPKPQVLPGDQLPDLIIMPPTHLTLEHPIGREAPDPLVPLGRKGCDPDEAFEFGAVRCLRFATGFGNIGVGPLNMHLTQDESQKATLGMGTWAQRIWDHDGNERAEPASPASYHKVHGHYHILGLDVSKVYPYDVATKTRGDPLGAGHKTGFCPVDSALVFPQGLGTSYANSFQGCCYMWGFCQLDFAENQGYTLGLSPGWYDVYPWWRADQYVDIGNAPDGTYELETCANPDGFMIETRMDNNCASAIFRLTGNDVEILESWSQALVVG